MVAKANNDARRTILDLGKGEWTEKKVILISVKSSSAVSSRNDERNDETVTMR